jgi:hypothetical protein
LTLDAPFQGWESTDWDALMQWMREGGRGRGLERVTTKQFGLQHFVMKLLQDGSLPSLKYASLSLQDAMHRASLTEGLVAAMHELHLNLQPYEDDDEVEPQLAALGLVRQLPALTKLKIFVNGDDDFPVQWPLFLPPSVQSLFINVCWSEDPTIESLLCALPGMLAASGARLNRLEVQIPFVFEYVGDALIHLAQALRCCSPTLKGFVVHTRNCEVFHVNDEDDNLADRVERLRVQWADVIAAVSACCELQVLVLPYIEAEPLFPPGTAFARLTHLEISDHEREHPPDAGVMGLWELMASGGLPALAKFGLRLSRRRMDLKEVRSRVAPALEAVAGTLTHLHLDKYYPEDQLSEEVAVVYELGVAVGKLRRLKDLVLSVSNDGRVLHALAHGLAAGGGDGPLPLLWRVSVVKVMKTHGDLLASVLLPSVRVFSSCHANSRAALLTACALRQAGYKHIWAVEWATDCPESDPRHR